MSVTDRQIAYRRQRKYLAAVENTMWSRTAETAGGAAFSVAHNLGATPGIVVPTLTSIDAADNYDWASEAHTETLAVAGDIGDATIKAYALCGIVPTEISTFGFGGIQFIEDDAVSWCRRVPIDFDPNWPLGFRAHFTSASATAADNFQFTVAFDIKNAPAKTSALAATAVAGTALAAASTALDTVIAAQTWIDTTTYKNTWSPRGIKNKAWSTLGAIEDGAVMAIKLTATTADTAAILLGLEIDYMPRLTVGHAGSDYDGPLVAAPAV